MWPAFSRRSTVTSPNQTQSQRNLKLNIGGGIRMVIDRYDIRTSSRRVFRRCLRKWGFQSSMRMGLERIGTETNINFWFGSAIHFAMEDYFGWNRFGDPRRAFKAYYGAFKPEDRPEGADDHYELGLGMLSYFLEWYPKHNSDMQFETLWFDENDRAVPPHTPGARPGVEQEFLFDLGYRVMVDVHTDKIVKEWDPKHDKLYLLEGYNFMGTGNTPIDPSTVEVGEGSRSYYYVEEKEDSESPMFDLSGKSELHEVRIVPICYHGTMDRLCVDRFGNWWILDYKTAKGADTRKLDTDDQISAYMWAAEQRFQHPFKGFIYLQLTKEVAKEPRRLKDGSLSVDKKQKTTYTLFKEAVIQDYGSVQNAPNKMVDMLNHLAEQESAEGDRFIRWDLVTRNSHQKIVTYKNIMAETKMMIDVNQYLFPNPTRDCGWDCPFRHICIAMDEGMSKQEIDDMIGLEFQRRDDTLEHNDDDWKSKIKWPESEKDLAAIDNEFPDMGETLNVILPDKYTEQSEE